MWPSRKQSRPAAAPPTPTIVNSETLTQSPHKVRFNLFHRAKEIVSAASPSSSKKTELKNNDIRKENRPKVNLFPQISLNDVRGPELDNVLDFTYGSDWKEASGFTARVSWMDLGAVREVRGEDATGVYSDRFRRQGKKVEAFDLPRSEVDLSKWYWKS